MTVLGRKHMEREEENHVTGCFLIVSLSTILAADFQNTIVNNFSVWCFLVWEKGWKKRGNG